MTVQSRGARSRRGGQGPGWPLMTALLVLAIAASSTLVFTDRVELLRLAVILSLWAAVMAAFVTVVYRRQSELDQARARDMKFVYDLQLDREISARREYELSVEAHLRRQLARELRVQAADEISELRSELVSLRSQLEVMFGTDLGERPALENDRGAIRISAAPGRVESSRVTVVTEEIVAITTETATVVESPIIDVPEEPLVSPEPPPPAPQQYLPPDHRGNHRQSATDPAPTGTAPTGPVVVHPGRPAGPPPQPEAPWRPPEVRRSRHATGDGGRRSPRPEPVTALDNPNGRHGAGLDDQPGSAGRHRDAGQQAVPQPLPEPAADPEGQHTGGQSLADLMARLQVDEPDGGGGRRRRRRRED